MSEKTRARIAALTLCRDALEVTVAADTTAVEALKAMCGDEFRSPDTIASMQANRQALMAARLALCLGDQP